MQSSVCPWIIPLGNDHHSVLLEPVLDELDAIHSQP